MDSVVLLLRTHRSFFFHQRLYKSGKSDDMHKYTLHPDDPDFIRAKVNAQQISDVRQLLRYPDTTNNLEYCRANMIFMPFCIFKTIFP